jgi:hypothetical protein
MLFVIFEMAERIAGTCFTAELGLYRAILMRIRRLATDVFVT